MHLVAAYLSPAVAAGAPAPVSAADFLLPAEVNPWVFVVVGAVVGAYLLAFLVWRRARAEEAAWRIQRARLRDEVDEANRCRDALGVAVVVLNEYGQVLLVNPTGCELLEREESSVVGHDWVELSVPPEQRGELRAILASIMQGDKGVCATIEAPLGSGEGDDRLVEWRFTAHTDAGGKITGVLCSGEDVTEQARTRKTLQQSRASLEQAQAVAHIGNWDWDLEDDSLAWSDEIYRIFGVEPRSETPSYSRFLMRVHPDDRRQVAQAVSQALRSQSNYSIEHRLVVEGGTEKYIHAQGEVVRAPDGSALRMVGTLQDVTARWKADRALRESEEMHRQLFSLAPVGIIITRTDGRIVAVNTALCELLDYSADELSRLSAIDFYPDPEERTRFLDMLQEEGVVHNMEMVLRRRNRTEFSAFVDSALINQGGEQALLTILRDITEIKRAEEELRESARTTRMILEALEAAVVVVDRDTARVTEINEYAEQLLGTGKERYLDRDVSEIRFVTPEGAEFFPYSSDEDVRTSECKLLREDETTMPVMLTVANAATSEGARQFVIMLDISMQKALEYQLAFAQKMESIGQLSAGIAHEINTPIQYVGDNIRFLQERLGELEVVLKELLAISRTRESGGDVSEMLDVLDTLVYEQDIEYLLEELPQALADSSEGVRRVADIVMSMKVFAHPGEGEGVKDTDINDAIQHTVRVARNEWKYVAQVVLDLDEELPQVPCRRGDFNQVLLNLVVNAAHAISDKVGESGEIGSITISTRAAGDWAEVRIQDTGIGIPEKNLSRIFDPFFTTKEVGRGTGQGLAIAYSIVVDKHGGTIDMESKEGEGSTVIIRLPLESCQGEECF